MCKFDPALKLKVVDVPRTLYAENVWSKFIIFVAI